MRLSETLVSLALISLCALVANSSAKKSDKELLEDLKKVDDCVFQSTFSFIRTEFYPPRTPEQFARMCKTQSEAFKCLKDKSKGSEPLVRRGLLAMVNTRSRQLKRLCSNPNSDFSKKFLAGSKCIMDKQLQELHSNDVALWKSMAALIQQNYNDSTRELKQLCCILHTFKKDFLKTITGSCSEHLAALEGLVGSMVTEDVTIVCDDDEKLARNCPKIEKIPTDKISLEKLPSPAVLSLYAFATLGEVADEPLNFT